MTLLSALLGRDPFDTPQAAVDWLLAPGTDRRHVALPLMADALKADGWVVLRDGSLDLPEYLRERGYVVYRSEAQAEQALLATLRNRGVRVFLPQSVPEPGRRWHVMRGLAGDRFVLPCETAGRVRYRNIADGTEHEVDELSWHKWRTKTRARCV